MKINQRYVILLSIAVFLIAFVFLYMSYANQSRENKQAGQNLSAANTAYDVAIKEKTTQEGLLSKANSDVAQLQSQLAQVKLQLQEKQQVIPQSVPNIDYNELLFNIARSNKLEMVSINTTGPTSNQTGDVSLFVTGFTISVTGNAQDILNFINQITSDSNFVSATIDGVTMSVSTEQAEDGTTVTTTQGNIVLSVYGYEE